MIEAMIFDLDGTLVQTERLKAISYARAAVELCPYKLQEEVVVEAFKEVVGRSRREVARTLMQRFQLESAARERMEEFGVRTAWQSFVQVRMQYYHEMMSDPETIRENRWSHTLDLLRIARDRDCRTALATMSSCDQTQKILKALDLHEAFDFVAARDDVQNGKPDPEIYTLVAKELDVVPKNCLVLEDSPSGVQAALRAAMHVVAMGTPFTKKRLHESELIPEHHIVEDPDDLPDVVEHVAEHVGTRVSEGEPSP